MKYLAMFLVLISSFTFGLEENFLNITREYEAGNYSQARNQLLQLLDSTDKSSIAAIINYDLGTTFLAEGKFDEALNHFLKISSNADQLPPLWKNLTNNLALVYLLKANEQIDKNSLTTELKKWMTALDKIEIAKLAKCHLVTLSGGSICPKVSRTQTMYAFTKENIAKILAKDWDREYAEMSRDQKIILFIGSLTTLKQRIISLQEASKTEQFQQTFIDASLSVILKDANSWNVLFTQLKSEVGKVNIAYVAYQNALSALSNANYNLSNLQIDKSLLNLTEAFKESLKVKNQEQLLQDFVDLFLHVNNTYPLQAVYVNALIVMQKEMEPFISEIKAISESKKGQFIQIGQTLQASLKMANQAMESSARIYLELSFGNLLDVIYSIKSDEISFENNLDKIIQLQEIAISLDQLLKKNKERAPLNTDVGNVIKEFQDKITGIGKALIILAKENEKAVFKSKNQTDLQQKGFVRWSEIIQKLLEGVSSSEMAFAKQSSIDKALSFQELALLKWNEALKIFKSKNRSQSMVEMDMSSLSDEQKAKDENIKKEADHAFNEVIEKIQEMERDDKSKIELKMQGLKGSERPW